MIDKEVLNKIKPGAEVKVYEKGGSMFHGIVLARKHGSETGAIFTVRTMLSDVGVEKVYPINSSTINKVEVLSSPRKVHRAKLYFLRKLSKKNPQKNWRNGLKQPRWRNWFTQRLEVPCLARGCGFESHSGHQD